MLLNQLRCEDGDPENLLRNSFYQFQADRALPDLEVDINRMEIFIIKAVFMVIPCLKIIQQHLKR